MEQELFTDIVKGEKREIDILAQVRLQGKEQIILIHVEPQASHQKEFHERMFIYCSRLYEKYRKPILPIAILAIMIIKTFRSNFRLNCRALQFLHLIICNFISLRKIGENLFILIIQ